MAHVPYVHSDDADEPAASILSAFEDEHDKRSLLLEALANHPLLLEAHSEYFDKTVKQGSLDRELKELVGVVVSEANECAYCIDSHRGNLVEMFGVPESAIDALAEGDLESFPEEQQVALEFARQAATDPKRVGPDTFEELREAGYGDGEIVELLGAVGQFAVANVYADTLAIHPSDREQ